MSCRLAAVWALAILTLAGPSVRGQTPFPQDLIPSRTALARLGLERQWMGVVPLGGTERLIRISRSSDLFFAQTDGGSIHAFDAQTGKFLWSARVGAVAPFARPVSSNSFGVFLTNANVLIGLDRKSGHTLWRYDLSTIPSSGTACDESKVVVGMTTGKIYVISLKQKDAKGNEKIRAKPVELLNWQSGGPVHTQPLPAERLLVFGSSDGRVYVSLGEERTPLYRIRTGGPIGHGFGTHGTRKLLIPSEDHNLYAVDLLTSKVLWTFPSGAPIEQAPIVAGEDIFVVNKPGYLSVLEPESGSPRWTVPTSGGRFLALSASKVYMRSENHDLFVIDRATGKEIVGPAASLQRAGLNLREFDLEFLNRFDDRMYLGTHSGMVVCMREIGQINPLTLRDPKSLPFGYIPPEGLKKTPPTPSATEPGAVPDASKKDDAPPEPTEDENKPEEKPQ